MIVGSVVSAVDVADAYCGGAYCGADVYCADEYCGAGAGCGAGATAGALAAGMLVRGWVSMAVMTASETPCCRKKTICAAVKLKEVPELFM